MAPFGNSSFDDGKELNKIFKKREKEASRREKTRIKLELKKRKEDEKYRNSHLKDIQEKENNECIKIIERHKNMPIAAKNRLQELLDNAKI